jgi:hypothetical protein
MNVYISLDGVLRNTIEKLEYHYNDYYLESDTEVDESFPYGIKTPIKNDNLLDYFAFQSVNEFENFLFIEFPLEIFGHAKPSYSSVFYDLNKLIFDNPDITFTIIGLDERGKARPASLFFLSKNNFLGYNVKFITSKKIKEEWKTCDLWITDNEKIIKTAPKRKRVIKFNTIFNEHIVNQLQINNLTQIETKWLKFSESSTSSTLTRLLMPAKRAQKSKTKTGTKHLK